MRALKYFDNVSNRASCSCLVSICAEKTKKGHERIARRGLAKEVKFFFLDVFYFGRFFVGQAINNFNSIVGDFLQ